MIIEPFSNNAQFQYRIVHEQPIQWGNAVAQTVWCEENCEGLTFAGQFAALFELESDATLYKVRWS